MPPKPSSSSSTSHAAPLSHFLCLPLLSPSSRPQIQSSLRLFAADLTTRPPFVAPSSGSSATPAHGPGAAEDGASGAETGAGADEERQTADPTLLEKALRPTGTLHLTLGVMSLPSPDSVSGALDLLRGLDLTQLLHEAASNIAGDAGSQKPAAAPPDPLIVSLRSLTSMHNPAKTSILYTSPSDPTGRLMPFAQRVRDAFVAAGYILPENRPLLLHATMLNTIYAGSSFRRGGAASRGRGRGRGMGWGGTGGKTGRNGKKLMLDARDVLERYDGFEFARDVQLRRVAICKMGAKKVLDANGEWTGEEEYEVVEERKILG